MIRWNSMLTNALLSQKLSSSWLIRQKAQGLLREDCVKGLNLMIMPRSFINKIVRLCQTVLTSICDNPHSPCRAETDDCWSRFLDDIMPLSTLEVVGIPRDKPIDQPIELLEFGGNATLTPGFINLNLVVGLTLVAKRFHVINARITFAPSVYHQYLKAICKGKKVLTNASG